MDEETASALWWQSDVFKYLAGYVIGVFSGIVANWLYDWYKRKRRPDKPYFTVSYQPESMTFEGHAKNQIEVDQIVKQVFPDRG